MRLPFTKLILGAVLGIVMFSSCHPERIYDNNKPVKDYAWAQNDSIPFTVIIDDTISAYDITLNVRHNSDYAFSNLFMFVTLRFPGGKAGQDIVECTLADVAGKWLGSGLGDVWDLQCPYRKYFKFPRKGIYTFELQQAMRVDILPNIMDVGIRIQKSSAQQ